MNPYLLTSATMFFLLGVIWNKDTWPNFLLKIVLLGMALWGFVLGAILSGFVVRR
jgi:hypothetical protein